jgi:hypothetical protein
VAECQSAEASGFAPDTADPNLIHCRAGRAQRLNSELAMIGPGRDNNRAADKRSGVHPEVSCVPQTRDPATGAFDVAYAEELGLARRDGSAADETIPGPCAGTAERPREYLLDLQKKFVGAAIASLLQRASRQRAGSTAVADFGKRPKDHGHSAVKPPSPAAMARP